MFKSRNTDKGIMSKTYSEGGKIIVQAEVKVYIVRTRNKRPKVSYP